MSRRKPKRREFHDGDPCDRRRPCVGVYRREHSHDVDVGATLVLAQWRCNSCGRKRTQMINKLKEPADG